jgi:hypothetical protein
VNQGSGALCSPADSCHSACVELWLQSTRCVTMVERRLPAAAARSPVGACRLRPYGGGDAQLESDGVDSDGCGVVSTALPMIRNSIRDMRSISLALSDLDTLQWTMG